MIKSIVQKLNTRRAGIRVYISTINAGGDIKHIVGNLQVSIEVTQHRIIDVFAKAVAGNDMLVIC
jgi:hypothetical protein